MVRSIIGRIVSIQPCPESIDRELIVGITGWRETTRLPESDDGFGDMAGVGQDGCVLAPRHVVHAGNAREEPRDPQQRGGVAALRIDGAKVAEQTTNDCRARDRQEELRVE